MIAGASYRLPYFIDFTTTLHSSGEARFVIVKQLQLTSLIGLTARAEYDTAGEFSWSGSLSYTLSKHFSLIANYDSDYGPGAGIGFRF